MADISDVENALVSLIAATLYPNGRGPFSAAGVGVAIYAGWPNSATLDEDLANLNGGVGGKLHVTVFASGAERNTTRYERRWKTATTNPATLTLSVSNSTVSISGTVSTPQNVMLMVKGLPYVYGVKSTDTLTSIATGLASLIPGASSSGPTITLPTSPTQARVGASGTSIREVARQEQVIQITVWADTPANRDLISKAIKPVLDDTPFIALADLTSGRLTYKSSPKTDSLQKVGMYRRDFMYSVEYATTQSQQTTQVVAGTVDLVDQTSNSLTIKSY